MCLVKRTKRIVGDAERYQTTTYYCSRSRNGRTCSLTRYEHVEKRYQESSKVISPETSRRRQSTTKTPKDSIWKVLSGPFSKERIGKAYDNQARSHRDQQATSRPQAQPPLSTQPDPMRDPFRPPEQADHRRIVSTPLVIDRSPREIVEWVRPATAPAPRSARPPRPRTPVEERPRVRQHPVYVHQNEPVAERHPISMHQLEPEPARRHPVSIHQTEPEPVRIEMTGGRRPESELDDHFSTFATFPSSSSSSSSEVVTEFEEDESYENDTIDELYRPGPRTPEVEGTLRRRRNREYLNARLEALQAQRRMEDAIRERREIENLANDVRHVLISGRAGGAGAGTLTRRLTNPVRDSRPMITAPPERAGDTTEDMGGFRRHSTVIARRNFTPPSYVIQEENRRAREESERVIENARARRNTQDPLDPAPSLRERHGGSKWRQSYYR